MQSTARAIARTASRSSPIVRKRQSDALLARRTTSALCSRYASTGPATPRYASTSATSDAVKPPTVMDDPYPIPLQNAAAMPRSDVTESDQYSDTAPHETDRPRNANEDLATYRARMVYQTRKRGTLETGLLLSTWMPKERIAKMEREELEQLERLMSVPEWTLFYWMARKQRPAEDSEWHDNALLKDLQEHTSNKDKQLRKMPELS